MSKRQKPIAIVNLLLKKYADDEPIVMNHLKKVAPKLLQKNYGR